MLRGLRGSLNDGSKELRDLHGCAYEDGSRASWRDGGYSAGKSACSFGYSTTVGTGANLSTVLRTG